MPVFKGDERDFEKRKLLYLSSRMAIILSPFMLIEFSVVRITAYFEVCNSVIIPYLIQLYKPQYSKNIYLSLFYLS